MEEVEALANRLIIMSAGVACCCGSPQHLKSRFGDGYILEIRLGGPQADCHRLQMTSNCVAASVAQNMLLRIPGAQLVEQDADRLVFRVPVSANISHLEGDVELTSRLSPATLFETVEAARGLLGITEYSLTQSSLERVFLSLARTAVEADNAAEG
jgi:ABC-type multidrug transport system ATPase subunit